MSKNSVIVFFVLLVFVVFGYVLVSRQSSSDASEGQVAVHNYQEVDEVPLIDEGVVVQDRLISKPIPEEPPVPTVEYAPDFTLPYLDGGGTFTLSDFRGEKPVIVDFFAEHCPNCRRSLPALEELAKKYEGQVEVVLVAIDSAAATRRYVKNRPVSLPIVVGDNRVMRDYQVQVTNIKAFIRKDGSLAGMTRGWRGVTEQDFLDLLEVNH